MGCMLAQKGEEGHLEKAIYYLSKRMTEYEPNYSPLREDMLGLSVVHFSLEALFVSLPSHPHFPNGPTRIPFQKANPD